MSLFAIRDFRRLFAAQIIALFGTGLATVALGLLAYDLAGPDAGAVLGTALTIKMVLYVVIAPLAAAFVDRLPRRLFLALLDVVRAGVVLALPFVSEVWHIYVLIALLQSASAAFTPTFQAVIPDIVTEEAQYTRALSASQVAYTMESLLSPVLAAVALTFMTFDWLFVGTSAGFAVSAVLVLGTAIPDARPTATANAWERISSGIQAFARAPQLRGIMALNLVVASAGAIVVVNTVNYVRDVLEGSQADVAWMLAASGGGTLVVAVALPRVLDRIADRTVMMTGSTVLAAAVTAALAMAATDATTWWITGAIWIAVGGGMALIVTPTGRVLRRSATPDALPTLFAAQFSLSHLAWLVTYPVAGWIGTGVGLAAAWSILLVLAASGAVAARLLWAPRARPVVVPDGVPAEATPGGRVPREPALAGAGRARVVEAEAAQGTLAAAQCTCVRTV
ncbi:MFS transporter [Nocardioides sp. BYT-33-1]|uniref:MFS transporter n=1 Tax=Nocardioides sp. BYT-33-1 TaxID=3416952 RepID=UPI003F53A1A0